MEEWGIAQMLTSLLKDFGLFVTLVAVLIWFSREGLRWLALHIGVPVVTKHLKFVDDLAVSLSNFDTTLSRISESQERLAESQEALLQKMDSLELRTSRSGKS